MSSNRKMERQIVVDSYNGIMLRKIKTKKQKTKPNGWYPHKNKEDFENIMLRKRGQEWKDAFCVTSFIWNPRRNKTGDRNQNSGWLGDGRSD